MPKPSLIIRFLTPKAIYAKWLVLLVLCGLLALGYYGYVPQIKQLLDQNAYAYKIGGFRLTPYVVMKALLAIVVLFWVAGIINDFTARHIHHVRGLKSSTRTLIAKIVQVITYGICILLSLKIVGIDLTALAVFSGAIGIGIGLGLQKITANFISGLILLSEKTLNLDDLVELGDGTTGYVRKFGARHTLVEALDGKEILIPNEDFITTRLINWTYSNKRARVDIKVSVTYNADLSLARQLLSDAATEHPAVLREPAPACVLNDFGESAALFELSFWISDITEGRAAPRSEVMFAIWRKLKESGIEMPVPQREVHLRNSQPQDEKE